MRTGCSAGSKATTCTKSPANGAACTGCSSPNSSGSPATTTTRPDSPKRASSSPSRSAKRPPKAPTSTSASSASRRSATSAISSARSATCAASRTRAPPLWQQAAHDLRGNLGVVSNVAEGLGFQALPADKRQSFLGLLRNNVAALRHLLDDVTSLARIQAGQEQRVIAAFDAAALLERLCNDFRPLAEEKGLYLEASACRHCSSTATPSRSGVSRRTCCSNALNYTKKGGVSVSWGEAEGVDERWTMTIADTGPGFHAGPGAPMIKALGQATSEAGPAPGRAGGDRFTTHAPAPGRRARPHDREAVVRVDEREHRARIRAGPGHDVPDPPAAPLRTAARVTVACNLSQTLYRPLPMS